MTVSGPRAWSCCLFSTPRPADPRGPRAPLLYGRRFRRYRTRRFSRRENRPIFWGSGGQNPQWRFCILLSLRAETRTKGSGRAVDNFLGRIAFFMRGHTATKVWPAGHLLSSHEERRQRRAKGVPPLGSPGSLPAFSLGKPAGGRTPNPPIYKKGLRPRGLGGHNYIDLYYGHPPCDS